MESAPPIFDPDSRRLSRLDVIWLTIWLAFLGGLAVLPPRLEWHKQVILLAIGIVQVLEAKIIARVPRRGVFYVILLKIVLATLLLDHTEEIAINSSYWPIYFVPVVTAALYCGPWATLLWTLFTSAAYCSYLYPAMQESDLTPEASEYLGLRIMFFFLAAMVVNRFSQQSRHQTGLYRELAERLAETNQRLEQAQAEARRSERLAALGQLSATVVNHTPLDLLFRSREKVLQGVFSNGLWHKHRADCARAVDNFLLEIGEMIATGIRGRKSADFLRPAPNHQFLACSNRRAQCRGSRLLAA